MAASNRRSRPRIDNLLSDCQWHWELRLERVRDALSKRAGGVDLVTSHVVREVIERGLDSIERDLARK